VFGDANMENIANISKVRLYKVQVRKLCNWYAEQILQNNAILQNRLITPSYKLEIERALENLQQKQRRLEPQNTIWTIPVKPVFHDQYHTFDIDFVDYNNVDIIDVDNPHSY